jgi:CHAT domain-containing protein
MKTMYALRTSEGLTKAEALQETQIQFIRGFAGQKGKDSKEGRGANPVYEDDMKSTVGAEKYGSYSHPYYWAPFILMGNWL